MLKLPPAVFAELASQVGIFSPDMSTFPSFSSVDFFFIAFKGSFFAQPLFTTTTKMKKEWWNLKL